MANPKKPVPTASLPRVPMRVVAAASAMSQLRRVRITKADGSYYVLSLANGVPTLLMGEAECRSVDKDVAGGGMHELKLSDEQSEQLLVALADRNAVDRIEALEAENREQQGELRLLQNELAGLRGNLAKA